MRTLLKLALFFIASAAAARISAFVISRQLDEGSEASDEFRRVVILDGTEFISQAGGLRSGEVCVVLGGAQLDLRETTLDPGGATLVLKNTLGGLQVLVRDDWAVMVEDEIIGGGGVEIDVTPAEDLPEGAPQLHISLLTRMAGSTITTKDEC